MISSTNFKSRQAPAGIYAISVCRMRYLQCRERRFANETNSLQKYNIESFSPSLFSKRLAAGGIVQGILAKKCTLVTLGISYPRRPKALRTVFIFEN